MTHGHCGLFRVCRGRRFLDLVRSQLGAGGSGEEGFAEVSAVVIVVVEELLGGRVGQLGLFLFDCGGPERFMRIELDGGGGPGGGGGGRVRVLGFVCECHFSDALVLDCAQSGETASDCGAERASDDKAGCCAEEGDACAFEAVLVRFGFVLEGCVVCRDCGSGVDGWFLDRGSGRVKARKVVVEGRSGGGSRVLHRGTCDCTSRTVLTVKQEQRRPSRVRPIGVTSAAPTTAGEACGGK